MKTRVLMVCLGNICRSPLAEGILRSKVDPEKVEVDSAATSNYHIGDSPDERSVAVAQKNNLDITYQRGRQFTAEDFELFDRIYVMDISNYRDVMSLARHEEHRQKVSLILNEIFPGENVEVPDPYQGGPEGFHRVYEMLEEACEVIAKKLDSKSE
ncbi:protein tyrosine phosphatase [Salinimicrobium catena]|uniref:protein-tyrosine-phosphatase n=1 Tax=Salinimicrobium catena TaxID=390640 RepID=A0A1H5L1I0_9FLAO|nr:low molecular weight protein-tyrosine-phosphatase [Salinimicrobium catena]SDL03653.1 protein-tyrosine phosphatase [Salinimicrobium catena]SEE70068.1 protein tyrosine phosphatase [Salinimicrobium catena]